MPAYEFQGFVSVAYPGLRDAKDQPVGLVEPGDVREFGEAPDHMWAQAGGGSGEGEKPSSDGGDGASEDPDPGAEGDAGGQGEAEHDGDAEDPETEPGA